MRRLFFVLAFLCAPLPATAQTEPEQSPGIEEDVATLFGKLGLTGTWSQNCSQSEGPSNWYIRYIEERGRIFQILTNSRSENRYEILGAKQLGPDRLQVRMRFTNPAVDDLQTHEWIVRDGRVRPISNISDKHGPGIVDGVILSNKQPTPWIERCK
jgi:hypothetical protein